MKIPFRELLVYPIPVAKSTPVTYASHIPTSKSGAERDILQPISSEEARAAYLGRTYERYGWCTTTLEYPIKDGQIICISGFS